MGLTEDDIKKMKVADLRKQLSDRGITLTGPSRKNVLVKKLIDFVKKEREEEEAEAEAEAEAEVEEEVEEEVEAEAEAEAEVEVEAEAEKIIIKEPSGPKAGEIILQRLEAKNEEDLTQVEKDILAAKARNAKFASEEATFTVSEGHKRKLRAQRFGPMPVTKKTKFEAKFENKKEEKEVVDDDEQKKRNARASRFGQPEVPKTKV